MVTEVGYPNLRRSVYRLAFARQRRYSRGMESETPLGTMTVYTSPHTGKTYEIVEVPQSRVDYRVPGDSSTRYERHYIEYQFYHEGKKVTWTYDLDPIHLCNVFGEIEGVYSPWETSRWD